MYPKLEYYDEWLFQLKQNLAISDNSRDNILLDYLDIAHQNIWTQYLKLPLEKFNWDHPLSFDKRVKLATIHLAASYFTNPDDTKQGQNVIDKRMIFRLLGELMNYG